MLVASDEVECPVYANSELDQWIDSKKTYKDLINEGAYLVIIDGTFGSTYDNNGVRQPNPVKDKFWIQIFR